MAQELGLNVKRMDKKFRPNKHLTEWNIDDWVICQKWEDKVHGLDVKWKETAYMVDRASLVVYLVVLPGKMRGDSLWRRWFHLSQLKPWKGKYFVFAVRCRKAQKT